MAHDHRTEIQPRREEVFLAQAQVAAWSAGHTERARATGLISVSVRMAAWHGERDLRASGPWAGFGFGFGPLRGLARGVNSARAGRGPFSIFRPNFVLNSNFRKLFTVKKLFKFKFNSLIKFEPTR
jgi:hypothetical protein